MSVAKGSTLIRGHDLLRFWWQTEQQGECLVWIGSRRSSTGYGKFTTTRPGGGTAHHGAHRWIWEKIHGPLAAGLIVRHTCDNPPCVNLAHLLPGTYKDNTADMDRRGRRGHSDRRPGATGDNHWSKRKPECVLRGEGHPNAKLNEEIVREIRRRVAEGRRPTHVAREMGLPPWSVRRVARGCQWSHVV